MPRAYPILAYVGGALSRRPMVSESRALQHAPAMRYHAGMTANIERPDPHRSASFRALSPLVAVLATCLLAPAACQPDADHHSESTTQPMAALSADEPAAPSAEEARERALVRELAHVVLSEHCGDCHFDDSPNAVQAALGIFNLNDPLWYTRLDLARLQSSKRRVDEQGSDDDKRTFDRFVAMENALRDR